MKNHTKNSIRLRTFLLPSLLITIFITASFLLAPNTFANDNELQKLEEATAANLTAAELSNIFHMSMGNAEGYKRMTATLAEIKGKTVEWTLPVYKVKKESNNTYKIQTKSQKGKAVGTFIYIVPRNSNDTSLIESLGKGSTIHFKGRITSQMACNLRIEPAIIINN